jgi:hypothetical protein
MFALCRNRTFDLLRSRRVFRPLRQMGHHIRCTEWIQLRNRQQTLLISEVWQTYEQPRTISDSPLTENNCIFSREHQTNLAPSCIETAYIAQTMCGIYTCHTRPVLHSRQNHNISHRPFEKPALFQNYQLSLWQRFENYNHTYHSRFMPEGVAILLFCPGHYTIQGDGRVRDIKKKARIQYNMSVFENLLVGDWSSRKKLSDLAIT